MLQQIIYYITKVYYKSALAAMNKFACKLYGYIVYSLLRLNIKHFISVKGYSI